MIDKKISYGIAAILFVIFVYLIFISHLVTSDGNPKIKKVPLTYLYAEVIVAIALSTLLSYLFLSKKIESFEKKFEVLLNLQNSSAKEKGVTEEPSLEVVLSLLSPNERVVMKHIISKKGQCLQSEITRLPNMTKLKAHRAVKSLNKKGIIHVERYGKTKRLVLDENIKDSFM